MNGNNYLCRNVCLEVEGDFVYLGDIYFDEIEKVVRQELNKRIKTGLNWVTIPFGKVTYCYGED